MNQGYKEILSQYFPSQTLGQVVDFLEKYSIHLKISRDRVTKLGDYRPPARHANHAITLNGGMGKDMLYLVFLHELAHLLVWKKYGGRVSPHGKQWKEEFSALLKQAVFLGYVQEHLRRPLLQFSDNIKATFASDSELWRLLKAADSKHQNEITIEEIPFQSYFKASNGKVFQKGEKLRKRYRCICLNNQRKYLFHPMAVIHPIQEKEIIKTSKSQ